MPARFFKALWGMEAPPADAVRRALDAGYHGVEAPLDAVAPLREAFPDLPLIAMLFETEPDALGAGLARAAGIAPVSVTVHAGKDWWPAERGSAFFREALVRVADSGLAVNFETHRGRLLHSPAQTAALLTEHPDLRLCFDVSHWTCVCESLLDDQTEAVDLALSRVGHLHARVGHEEGPQVPDPRAPRWSRAVDRHLAWWDRLAAADPDITVTPEFGPPDYLWTTPAGEPLADLWEVCLWTRDRLAERWG